MIPGVRIDDFDPGRLLDVLGMQWKEFCGLKRPLTLFSVLRFFDNFQVCQWCFLRSFLVMSMRVLIQLMYGMIRSNKIGPRSMN